jgi:hypothetical protein
MKKNKSYTKIERRNQQITQISPDLDRRRVDVPQEFRNGQKLGSNILDKFECDALEENELKSM